jgi:hypothetical protein
MDGSAAGGVDELADGLVEVGPGFGSDTCPWEDQAMQFESWEDAVKKAKAKTVEGFPDVVVDPDPVPSTGKPARSGSVWKASAIALCVLVVFGLGFLVASLSTVGRGARPADGVRSDSVAPGLGGIARGLSAPPYTILLAEGDHAKDVIYVRLREKVTKDVLAGHCREIRRKGSTGKERTVIWFYLPQVDAFKAPRFGWPWAFADFDPGLKLEIRGFDAEQEAKLVASPIPPGRVVVGRWLDDSAGGGLYTIYREDGLLYVEAMGGHPGGGIVDELVEVGYPAGQRFERKKLSRAGDYYLIDLKGDLEVRDGDGLISVCKKVG